MSEVARYRILETALGTLSFVATSRGVARLYTFDTAANLERRVSREFPTAKPDEHLLDTLAKQLVQYAVGACFDLDAALDWDDRTPFVTEVIDACQRVPAGETTTYRELAEAVGRPRAARAVGNVMRTNRVPLIVPCHRVLRSDGALGGFTAPGGLQTKQTLLDHERGAQQIARVA